MKNKYGIVNEKQVNKAANLILTDILFQEKDRMLYGGLRTRIVYKRCQASANSSGTVSRKNKMLNSMDKNDIYGKVHDLALYTGRTKRP